MWVISCLPAGCSLSQPYARPCTTHHPRGRGLTRFLPYSHPSLLKLGILPIFRGRAPPALPTAPLSALCAPQPRGAV